MTRRHDRTTCYTSHTRSRQPTLRSHVPPPPPPSTLVRRSSLFTLQDSILPIMFFSSPLQLMRNTYMCSIFLLLDQSTVYLPEEAGSSLKQLEAAHSLSPTLPPLPITYFSLYLSTIDEEYITSFFPIPIESIDPRGPWKVAPALHCYRGCYRWELIPADAECL